MESASFSPTAASLTWISETTSGRLYPCLYPWDHNTNVLRYLDIQLTRDNNITTGKIYQSVIVRMHPY